ncbi:hypothetical protein M409DRAFT_25619 [Zasmidium cellare ATCC 36951]|uniref:DUF3669 domain-containing protein n=1 Tax=Zasmidium cellare ATCC 36951 TaxID=1080233 RepID=A0A6A6C9M5_ZASCE|nr:uncharacterized protein M409DRAFT_25619 [Zasmidium cellare ATCC 36951]KAF2163844.1 hypothetical protein M409DRAFT_25619 [Zasmidium cellare ATCC 36951]
MSNRTTNMTNNSTTLPPFVEIGSGSCGRVYSSRHPSGSEIVLKRARPGQTDRLWQDYLMHTKILEALHTPQGRDIDILVPDVLGFVTETDRELWEGWEGRFPGDGKGEAVPRDVLLSERISAVGRGMREEMVEVFCVEGQRGEARGRRENEDCLVRVCFGEGGAEEEGRASKSVLRRAGTLQTTFSLRNFPLTLSKLDRAPATITGPLSPPSLTRQIAQTLALLHWSAHVDARDVEFVLGGTGTLSNSTPHSHPLPYDELAALPGPTSTFNPVFLEALTRPLNLWLLDFNQVKTITMDEAGVESAVAAFVDSSRTKRTGPAGMTLEEYEDLSSISEELPSQPNEVRVIERADEILQKPQHDPQDPSSVKPLLERGVGVVILLPPERGTSNFPPEARECTAGRNGLQGDAEQILPI